LTRKYIKIFEKVTFKTYFKFKSYKYVKNGKNKITFSFYLFEE